MASCRELYSVPLYSATDLAPGVAVPSVPAADARDITLTSMVNTNSRDKSLLVVRFICFLLIEIFSAAFCGRSMKSGGAATRFPAFYRSARFPLREYSCSLMGTGMGQLPHSHFAGPS